MDEPTNLVPVKGWVKALDERPPNVWLIKEAGTILLPLTGYEITYDIKRGGFKVSWYGHYLGIVGNLDQAKQYVTFHMHEMLQVGHEP